MSGISSDDDDDAWSEFYEPPAATAPVAALADDGGLASTVSALVGVGLGRIVALETEGPNMLANLV